MRKISSLLAVVLFLICLAVPVQAAWSSDTASRTVRVGYFAFSGFQDVDDNGNYSGYGYEYLKEIAQYTDWNYEFVPATWDECLDMLARGEIDLLGSAQRTAEREERYEFAALESGVSYAILSVPAENAELAYEDFESFDGMRVGMLRGSSRNRALEEYCKENGFTIDPQIYDSLKELQGALHAGQVDAIVTSNLRRQENERVVAKFAPSPFYYMTTKGNQELINELNNAQNQIKTNHPHYDAELYDKYYGVSKDDLPVFTRAEKEFIKSSPVLKVAYDPAWGPLASKDPKTGSFKGIVSDLLERVQNSTGLRFEFVPSDNLSSAVEQMNSGKIDLISAVDCDYMLPKDLVLTNPYISTYNVIVTDPLQEYGKDSFVAVTEDFALGVSDYVEKDNLLTYGNTEECFDALLNNNQITAVYANAYAADLLRSNYHFSRFQVTVLPNLKDELCMALSRGADKRLLSILNKAILFISEEELQETIVNNTVMSHDLTFHDFIYQNPFQVILVSSSVLLIIILCLGYVAFFRTRANRQVFRLLNVDNLTGIWNFNYFQNRMKSMLVGTKNRYAVVYTDIERFKDFNEAYGYAQGDMILKRIAEILREGIDDDELFARVSNDVFVAMLKFQDEASLITRLIKFDSLFNSISKNENETYKLMMSSGIYVLKETDRDVSFIVDCANDARKTIKGRHKSDYAFFDEKLQNELLLQRGIESEMDRALREGQFVPFFQPKVELRTAKIVGAEALARWIHPQRGLIPPMDFVPLFEKNGFIVELDFYILECVCKMLRNQLERGLLPVPVSSNFSRINFNKPNFVPRIKGIVEKYAIPPHLLELEVTESIVDSNPELLFTMLNELRGLGFLVDMDDFGSGYSSLNLLKNMPVDVLKLDKDFLRKGIVSEKDRIIIEGFVSIAKRLHISVVCEGVETQEQVAFLSSIGCEYAQGYLFAKPMPLVNFEALTFADSHDRILN